MIIGECSRAHTSGDTVNCVHVISKLEMEKKACLVVTKTAEVMCQNPIC